MKIIAEPIEFCMVNNRLLRLTDRSGGLWYCDTVDNPKELLPVPRDQFEQSDFIAEVSGKSGFLAKAYQAKLTHWKMIYFLKDTN